MFITLGGCLLEPSQKADQDDSDHEPVRNRKRHSTVHGLQSTLGDIDRLRGNKDGLKALGMDLPLKDSSAVASYLYKKIRVNSVNQYDIERNPYTHVLVGYFKALIKHDPEQAYQATLLLDKQWYESYDDGDRVSSRNDILGILTTALVKYHPDLMIQWGQQFQEDSFAPDSRKWTLVRIVGELGAYDYEKALTNLDILSERYRHIAHRFIYANLARTDGQKAMELLEEFPPETRPKGAQSNAYYVWLTYDKGKELDSALRWAKKQGKQPLIKNHLQSIAKVAPHTAEAIILEQGEMTSKALENYWIGVFYHYEDHASDERRSLTMDRYIGFSKRMPTRQGREEALGYLRTSYETSRVPEDKKIISAAIAGLEAYYEATPLQE